MKSTKRPYHLAIRAQDADSYEIAIRGIIGEYVDYERWTISDTEEDVLNELKQIPEGKHINVRVNSRGGDVGLGLGIYNALSRRKKDVTTFNDGYALSAASIVMLAGSKRVSPAASVWMIHRAQGGVDGTGQDMRSMADGMDVIDGMMAAVYAEVSGKKSKEEFLAMMNKTTWLDGAAACELGLATDCTGELPAAEDDEDITDAEKRIIAALEKTIPANLRARVLAKAPAARASLPGNANPAPPTNKPNTKTMKKITAALVAAGITVAIDAEEDAVLPHITALLNSNKDLKAALAGHETALKERVTKKVEAAITEKLIKAERKEKLIAAGLADESTLDFIDDIRADAAAKRTRGVTPARKEGEANPSAEEVETQIGEQVEIIHAANTSPATRANACRESLKLRGLDKIIKKPNQTN